MVECSRATRAARVRLPADALFLNKDKHQALIENYVVLGHIMLNVSRRTRTM